MELNEEQKIAVEHDNGPCLVVACPGSGKTRTIVERYVKLVENGNSANRILSITFTNKAANEMKSRVLERLPSEDKHGYIGTFHAFCARLLRHFGGRLGYTEKFTILDDDDQKEFITIAAKKKGIKIERGDVFNILKAINDYRETMEELNNDQNALLKRLNDENDLAGIALQYIENIHHNNSIDFSGLLSETVKLFVKHPDVLEKLQDRFDYLQVDEVQDTNAAQFFIAEQLVGKHNNFFAVGDLDQCHPAGTKISLSGGKSKPIEEVDIGDEVVVYNSKKSYFPGTNTQGRKVLNKAKQDYNGEVIEIITKSSSCIFTPNHKCLVRCNNMDKKYCLYLMHKGNLARIGISRMIYFTGFGPSKRANQEKADAVWVLDIFETEREARVAEAITSAKHGLPQLIFTHNMQKTSDQKFIDAVYNGIGNNIDRAIKCINEFGRDFRYPIWNKRDHDIAVNSRHNYISGKKSFITQACNLISGAMQVRVFDGTPRGGAWETIAVNRHEISEPVYSLEVESTEGGRRLYIANNIVTHNSIYRFRGAQPDNIRDYMDNHKGCKVVRLHTNYRSTPEIIKTAATLINKNTNRLGGSRFEAVNSSGNSVRCVTFADQEKESDWIAKQIEDYKTDGYKYGDVVVLYRINAMSEPMERALVRHNIPYNVVGGRGFYDRAEIRDILAMLRLFINPLDMSAFRRIVKIIPGIGATTVDRIETLFYVEDLSILEAGKTFREKTGAKKIGEALDKIIKAYELEETQSVDQVASHFIEALDFERYVKKEYEENHEDRLENIAQLLVSASEFSDGKADQIERYLQNVALITSSDKDAEEAKVSLMTGHAVKGLEFPIVFMIGVEQGILPHWMSTKDDSDEHGLEEERRLAYVGITRAQEILYLSHCKRRKQRGKGGGFYYKDCSPSQFLREAGLSSDEYDDDNYEDFQ